ncbi:MAG: S28 family serine protease [Bacteroidota bacterium]
MKLQKLFSFLVVFIFISSFVLPQQETELFKKLKSLKEVASITPIKTDTTFSEGYQIMIYQPVDHNNPKSEKFKQKVYLLHKNESLPTVLALEGYSADFNRPYELTRILQGNQVLVEHRYFGQSIPEKLDWNYLTVKQAAADHHEVVRLFKKIYNGKWISTGISKGGQTAIFFKRFYPKDVDAAVTYVAPVNYEMEDARITQFLKTVGSDLCRKSILEYQRAFLQRREEIMPLLMQDVEKQNIRLSFDWEFFYEIWVLEYSFTFWQYGAANCDEIPPPDTDAKTMFEHMKKVVGYGWYSEQGVQMFLPSYIQFYKEIGYYNYDLEPFKDLLVEVKDGSSIFWIPEKLRPKFDNSLLKDIRRWLKTNSNNIIFIYGELDTWTATAVELTGKTNALKIVRKGGYHGTNIKSLDLEDKELLYSTLEKWLDIKIKR